MRRTAQIVGGGLCIWQLVVLAVGTISYLSHREGENPALPKDELRLVTSLIRPSEADIRSSVRELEAMRRVSRADGNPEPWRASLISSLQSGDFDSAQRQWADLRDKIPPQAFDCIARLIDRLALRRNDFETETQLALALCSGSCGFSSMEAWAWRLWDRAERPVERARLARVLAGVHDKLGNGTLHRGSLRLAAIAADLPREEYADSVVRVAGELVESGRPGPALALYREAERVTLPGPIWGPAVYNQGLLLYRSGYYAASRSALLRLIAGTVDDKEPGGSLMRTNQNYRYYAANLIADSYNSEWAFAWAYRWRLRATEQYRYYSWCGTCSGSARQALSIRLLRDALFAGPVFALVHIVLHPGQTWPVWCILIALPIYCWYRRRRRSAGQSEPLPAA